MKCSALCLLLCLLPAGGCSMLIAGSGTDFSHLETAEQVHAELGPPDFRAVELDGTSYDCYVTRQKICHDMEFMNNATWFGLSAGLGELYLFPRQIVRLSGRTILGQFVYFGYHDDGRTREIFVEDEYGEGRTQLSPSLLTLADHIEIDSPKPDSPSP